MLMLSRRRDEKIMIGDDIEIMVVEIRGNKVTLGIAAPPSTSVHRKEIYDIRRVQADDQCVDTAAEQVELVGAG